MKTGLFYGSTLGAAKGVAELIAKEIEVDIYEVSNGIDDVSKYDLKSVPTTLVFEGEEVVKKIVGISKEVLL